MQPKVFKYILDIEGVIDEIEIVKDKTNNNYDNFKDDLIFQRAIERNLEIIGEAIKKIKEIDPLIEISGSKNIIGLRNLIAHAYDSIEPEMLWGIIQINVPALALEIKRLRTL